MEIPEYITIHQITQELEPNVLPTSDEFKKLAIYVTMNWTRSYFMLRKILPEKFDKSMIEQCRQRFIRKMIRPKWLNEIVTINDNELIKIQIEVALISLYVEDKITRVRA